MNDTWFVALLHPQFALEIAPNNVPINTARNWPQMVSRVQQIAIGKSILYAAFRWSYKDGLPVTFSAACRE